MKKPVLASLLGLVSLYLPAQNFDTTIRGVHVGFTFHPEIFPSDWLDAPIDAKGKQIDLREVPRCKKIIATALAKYPVGLLKLNLASVYFVGDMAFYQVGYGGTNSQNAVYLADQGIALHYTNRYLEQTFHHEFSSILLRNHYRFIDTTEWKLANKDGFFYNDPENGVGAIRNNQSSQELDTLLCEKGLLTEYGGSSLENDINTFAQNLFCPEKNFWANVDHFPRIRKKALLLISFYGQLSPVYTESYFRDIDKKTSHADPKQISRE